MQDQLWRKMSGPRFDMYGRRSSARWEFVDYPNLFCERSPGNKGWGIFFYCPNSDADLQCLQMRLAMSCNGQRFRTRRETLAAVTGLAELLGLQHQLQR